MFEHFGICLETTAMGKTKNEDAIGLKRRRTVYKQLYTRMADN